MAKIEIENLSHSYFTESNRSLQILKNINLSIENSELVVVLGESGCGKTTFLNIIAGYVNPMEGNVWVNNRRYSVSRPHFSRSLLSQQPCLLPWLNVRENISFGCRLRKDTEDLNNRVNKFIRIMGLEGFEKALPGNLSVGMAQRVSFARALIGKPEMLLLDEPFAALDFITRRRLQDELVRIWQREKFTMLFVTHDIDEAILMGQKIVILGNSPASIEHVISINTPYPRTLAQNKMFKLKVEIQEKFKETMDVKY
jgi:NitT/TauT family transport system ATP-binding protein